MTTITFVATRDPIRARKIARQKGHPYFSAVYSIPDRPSARRWVFRSSMRWSQ